MFRHMICPTALAWVTSCLIRLSYYCTSLILSQRNIAQQCAKYALAKNVAFHCQVLTCNLFRSDEWWGINCHRQVPVGQDVWQNGWMGSRQTQRRATAEETATLWTGDFSVKRSEKGLFFCYMTLCAFGAFGYQWWISFVMLVSPPILLLKFLSFGHFQPQPVLDATMNNMADKFWSEKFQGAGSFGHDYAWGEQDARGDALWTPLAQCDAWEQVKWWLQWCYCCCCCCWWWWWWSWWWMWS